MNRAKFLATTAAGTLIGVVAFSVPALADLPVIDVSSLAQMVQSVAKETGILDVLQAMQTVQSTINDAISDIKTAIGGTTFGDTNTLLQEGFTQISNYSKAQIGAIEQITDASNLVNAQFRLQLHQAKILNDHVVSTNHCTALDGGVSTMAAAVQGYDVAWTIAKTHNARGQAQPNMPSYYGQAQAVASMAQEHLANYCDQKDVDAGLCSALGATPDGDSAFSSLFGSGTYGSQDAINMAKDYAVNLIEPTAPAALRGDQLSSVQGQDAAVRRRSFDARMSLAQSIVDLQIGMQTPSVPITQTQQQYLTNMGLPAPANGNISWFQALQIEAERRVSDVGWAATLAGEPQVAVEREIAQELALNNYLAFQNFKLGLQHVDVSASQLAEATSRDFVPTSQLPTPSIATAQ
jgi:hypothetical protein